MTITLKDLYRRTVGGSWRGCRGGRGGVSHTAVQSNSLGTGAEPILTGPPLLQWKKTYQIYESLRNPEVRSRSVKLSDSRRNNIS